ncbi:MAG: hypothetical protein MUP55_03040 [Candidatus Aenigmarchaeota archaeon]|nr:hypothetical protein [Candidatus Aenigmarchaeota archaeon]
MAEKDEEKKADSGEKRYDFDEFERDMHRTEAKEKMREYIRNGYFPKFARQLAILEVRKEIREEILRKSFEEIRRLRKLVSTARSLAPERTDIIRSHQRDIRGEIQNARKLQEEITKIDKEIDGVEKKQEAGQKSYFERENEKKLKLDKLKSEDLDKDEYEKEKGKIEGFYKDIDDVTKEKILEERKEEGVPTRFTCPQCGHHLYEEYDKEFGRLLFKCSNKKCISHRTGGYKPEYIYETQSNKFNEKVPIPPLLRWKQREAADRRLDLEKRLVELKQAIKEGHVAKEKEKEETDKIWKDVYGDKDAFDRELGTFKRNNPGATSDDLRREEKRLKREHNIKDRTVVEKYGGGMRGFSKKGEEFIKKVIFVAALIGIGAVISASLGQTWFFFGFLSIGLYVLTPSSDVLEPEPGPFGWSDINPWKGNSGRAGMKRILPSKTVASTAWLRSIFKVTAIICFAMGFKSMGDIFNTFFIITCLIGYFALKLTYNNSGEFIESLLRFAVLGCYFIPFNVFAGIFNSYVLGAIALAFFAIPPMPASKDWGKVIAQGLSGQTAYYEMFDKILFIGLMGFALIASGSFGVIWEGFGVGWGLTGTLRATFIYFWIVSAIGGFFSPPQERPLTGILFLGGATIIYAVGPGSQDIGSALLGQWWPSVNQAVTTISEPISKMFGQLGKTFGDAFLLLTNPVGYATQLMNGSYANSGPGEVGAFGVELSGFEVSPVFIEQPFMITTNIKNSGTFPAEDVRITLTSGLKAPEKQSSWTGTPSIGATKTLTQPIKISQLQITDSCKNKQGDADKDTACIQYFDGKFIQQNIWQAVFSSSGIKCDVSSAYELRKKSIPINVTLSYKYQSDSKVSVEFISQAEWDRLAKLDQLNQKLQFVKSEYSSAPVKFPIGTPGLKNPILETQDFHIALNIMSDQIGGKIDKIESIRLNYPKEFTLDTDECNPKLYTKPAEGIIEWGNLQGGDRIFYCHFKAVKDKMGGSPTKTYIINAHANYTYSVSKEKLVKVEFGSWCCYGETDSCAKTSYCCPEVQGGKKGICIPQGQNCAGISGRDCSRYDGSMADCLKISEEKKQAFNYAVWCDCNEGTEKARNDQLVSEGKSELRKCESYTTGAST